AWKIASRAIRVVNIVQTPDDVHGPGMMPWRRDYERLIGVKAHRARSRQCDIRCEIGDEEIGSDYGAREFERQGMAEQRNEDRIQGRQIVDADIRVIGIDPRIMDLAPGLPRYFDAACKSLLNPRKFVLRKNIRDDAKSLFAQLSANPIVDHR